MNPEDIIFDPRYAHLYEAMHGAVRVSVAAPDIAALWAKLVQFKPIKSNISLHIAENVYSVDGVQYSCLWSLGNNIEQPEMIDILKPMAKPQKRQAELF